MKRLWNSMPWNKRKLEAASYEQELEEVREDCNATEVSHILNTSRDDIDERIEVPPVFSAIQLYDVDELKRLLDELGGSINEAKYGGLTPLHTVCHIKSMQMLQIILEHGAEVNQFDDIGYTALHIAVEEGWHEGVKLLLEHKASPDLLSYPSHSREGDDVTQTPLHAAVQKGDLESTLLILKSNPDLGLRNGNQCTILHLAARSLNVPIFLQLLEEKSCQDLLSSKDSWGNSLMHAALAASVDDEHQDSLEKILRALFEAGVEVNSVNMYKESPIYHAALFGYHRAVKFLISLGTDLNIITDTGYSLIHAACRSGNATCLRHLLDAGCVSDLIIKADNQGNEPFHYAVKSCSVECCELLLSNGDHLTRKDKDGTTRCALLLDHLSSAPELLKRMFDKCITFSDKPQHDPDFRINFNYSILLSQNHDFQSSLISDINSKIESESFLKHPLIESFLFRKWNKMKFFFYTNVFIFFVFLLLHSFYIISMYKKNPMPLSKDGANLWIFRFLHILMYMLILIPEVIITISHPKRHTKHWESLTKIISLLSSAFVVFIPENTIENIEEITPYNNTVAGKILGGNDGVSFQRHMAAISAFFGWVELMMLCGRFPALGVYALMFTRIAKSMLFFITAFITLLIGFAISFLVLLYKNNSFATFWHSIMKTLMMMVGELDYEGLVEGDPPLLGYIVIVVFLFLVSILVVNLLIGLAVNDIANLELMGKIQRLSKQASFLVSLEHVIMFLRNWRIFPRKLTKCLENILDIKQTLSISLNKRCFKSHWKYKIPSEIIEAALEIGNTTENKNKDEEIQKTLNEVLRMMATLQLPNQLEDKKDS